MARATEPAPAPPASLAAGAGGRPNPSLSPTITCWDCEAPNPPGRVFCAECGTFIAVGSKVFSGGAGTGQTPPDRSVVAPLTPGAMSLGAYSVAMRRQAQRRRVVLGLASVALVAVVGLAWLYVASSPRDGATDQVLPAVAAATAEATEEPAAEARRNMGPAVGAVDLSEVELEPVQEAAPGEDDPAVVEEAEAETGEADPLEPEPMTEPAAEPQPPADVEPPVEAPSEPDPRDVPEPAAEPVPAAEPEPQPEAVSEPEPEAVTDLEPEAPSEPEQVAEPEAEGAEAAADDSIVWRNGWVCGGELSLQDSRLRDWTITRASFLPGSGFERVELQLQRIGPGTGEPASLRVEAFPRTKVAQEVPGVRQPGLGRTAIALQFSDGVKTDLTLRRYRPTGLVTIRELSAYPAGGRASRVILSASAEGCFRVRAPAWSESNRSQRGQIVIDVKS